MTKKAFASIKPGLRQAIRHQKGQRVRGIKLTAEHPEADPKHIVSGVARRGLKPIT
jgi:hypothetical protein